MKLKEAGVEAGKKLFNELRNECEGESCGAGGDAPFEFEGKTYKVHIDGFWEKSSWFDFHVFGNGSNEKGSFCY